jgi:hypothetical protein
MASDGTGFAGRSFAPSNVAVAIGPVGLGGWSGRSVRWQSPDAPAQGPALRERHSYNLHRLNAANTLEGGACTEFLESKTEPNRMSGASVLLGLTVTLNLSANTGATSDSVSALS